MSLVAVRCVRFRGSRKAAGWWMNLVVIMQKAFKHLIDPRAKDNSCSSHQKKKKKDFT